MGTAKRQSNKYKSPKKIWDKARIDRDIELRKTYGFKNKKELWKIESLLRGIRNRARKLISLKALGKGEMEEKEFIRKLHSLGLVNNDATVDDVLDLELTDFMERRLQTLVLKKKMARSIRESRQMITHRHVQVGEKIVDTPSYIVKRDEESKIVFAENSPFAAENHPIKAVNKESNV